MYKPVHLDKAVGAPAPGLRDVRTAAVGRSVRCRRYPIEATTPRRTVSTTHRRRWDSLSKHSI